MTRGGIRAALDVIEFWKPFIRWRAFLTASKTALSYFPGDCEGKVTDMFDDVIERLSRLEKLGVTMDSTYTRDRLREPSNLVGAEAQVSLAEYFGPRLVSCQG